MPRDAIGAWEVRADGSRTPACRARAPRPRPTRAHPGVGERLLHVHADMYILYFAVAGHSCEVEIFTGTTGTNGLPKDSIGHLFFDDALIDDVPTPFGRPMLLPRVGGHRHAAPGPPTVPRPAASAARVRRLARVQYWRIAAVVDAGAEALDPQSGEVVFSST